MTNKTRIWFTAPGSPTEPGQTHGTYKLPIFGVAAVDVDNERVAAYVEALPMLGSVVLRTQEV